MRSSFDPPMLSFPDVTIMDDPYTKFIIDRRHHESIYYTPTGTPNRTCKFSHAGWETITQFGRKFVRIKSSSSETYLDIFKELQVPRSGLYRVEVLVLRGPDYNGTVRFMDGSTQFDDPISTNSTWLSVNWFKTHLRRFKAGTHTFKIRISKGAAIAAMKIVPVTRHEGDSDGSYYGENELEILGAEWSRNSVNELNPASIDLVFQGDFYQTDHHYAPFIFSFKDSITILAGEKRHQTQPVFGGYIVSWVKKGGKLNLGCFDSLLNLNADVMYENYAIGNPPEKGKVWKQFSNLYDTLRYMAETTLHRINPYNIPHQYGFKLDFGAVVDYNSIIVSGFGKERNATAAYPGYCLKLYRDSTGAAQARIYENLNNPYDAAKFPILNMDYQAADGTSAMNFDIFITMHKHGEELGDAEEYAIKFSGAGGHSNTIATVTPILNGNWNYISLNLPALFKAKGIRSTAYYVSKIELKGTIGSTSPPGAMYLNNIGSYKLISNTTRHSNTEVKSIFEIIQALGESTNHAIYIQPGLERCDDILVTQPNQNSTIPVMIDDSRNLIECEEYGSRPLEDGFLNQAHANYNITDTNIGSSFAENLDSVIHYEEYQRHEFVSDLKTQAEVDKATTERANNLSYPNEYLTCRITGNPFLDPNQNIYYTIGEHRCNGNGMVKSLDYNYDPSRNPSLDAVVGVNRSTSLRNNLIFKIWRDIYNIKLLNPGGGDIFRSRVS